MQYPSPTHSNFFSCPALVLRLIRTLTSHLLHYELKQIFKQLAIAEAQISDTKN